MTLAESERSEAQSVSGIIPEAKRNGIDTRIISYAHIIGGKWSRLWPILLTAIK